MNAFIQAQQDVRTLDRTPGAAQLLQLYALYKQGTAGDVQGARPGGFNPVGAAKYDAWAGVSGMTPDDARAAYVALVAQLRDSD